jgi:hypothetical protein
MLPLLASSECFALKAHHQPGYLQCVRHDGKTRLESGASTLAGYARARFFLGPSEEDEGLVQFRDFFTNIHLCRILLSKMTPAEKYCHFWPGGSA